MDGGDIAFNELVKECLFVHGWNGRTGRRGESSLLCPIMYKGDSIYDVRKVLGFFDPPSPLCPNFMYCLSAKLGYFLTPLSADVIYGSPLTQNRRRGGGGRRRGLWGFPLRGEGEEGKIDEILHLNGRQTGTRLRRDARSYQMRLQ